MPEEMYYTEEEVEASPEETPPDEGDETALLPLSIFPDKDLKVGSKCSFEVTEILENEVVVKYAKPEKDSDDVTEEEMTMDMKIDRAAV